MLGRRLCGLSGLLAVAIVWTVGCRETEPVGRPDRTGDSTGQGADASAKGVKDAKNKDGGKTSPVDKNKGTNGKPERALNVESLALLGDLPKGEQQRQRMCATKSADKVHEVFCSANPPKINNLKDLQKALGLDLDAGGGGILGGLFGGVGFTFSAASSSLVAKQTSSINPRLIMFTRGNTQSLVALGFVRGDQFAEVAARDPQSGEVNFFLVQFKQDCNDKEAGCSPGDLLTPAIEKDWREVTIYEDTDLENTIVDCLQCHQPDGKGTRKMLRMQERVNPWVHFMRTSTGGGRQLLADFQAKNGDEEYAGIPASRFGATDPAQLQALVEGAGFINQPNEFNSVAIPGQTNVFSNERVPQEWNRLYDGFVQGKFIAPPYHQLRISDDAKLKAMTEHYQAYRRGEVKAEELKDIREIHDDKGLRDMGFMVKEGLSGQEIIIQACSQCHHDRLNQDITRARFKLDPSKMDCKERELAIERLNLPAHDIKRMPPNQFRSLTADEIAKATEVLRCKE